MAATAMKEATDAGNGGGRAGRRRQSDGRSRWRRPSRTTAATRLTLQTAATEQDGWLCGGRGYGVDREGRMRRVGGSEETAAAGSTRSAVAVEEERCFPIYGVLARCFSMIPSTGGPHNLGLRVQLGDKIVAPLLLSHFSSLLHVIPKLYVELVSPTIVPALIKKPPKPPAVVEH
ncbi:hypothetical protein OsJ_13956 [Oryza sativa Japonica Group]|uniref:Uncharacterized protein n=1 Tax=Oryza sativa subsp. japonica TaxID=39947 RepID=B9FDZ7_ORYSJ|nr:hypothetical protein OsJ_13956 [Oryza sativa Japonica Group]